MIERNQRVHLRKTKIQIMATKEGHRRDAVDLIKKKGNFVLMPLYICIIVMHLVKIILVFFINIHIEILMFYIYIIEVFQK